MTVIPQMKATKTEEKMPEMIASALEELMVWLLLALLYSPILIIMIFSFTEAKVLGNWTGFSTKLYSSLFTGGMHPCCGCCSLWPSWISTVPTKSSYV